MLDEALGENRAYFLRHGYHADILRDSILETLPGGWEQRRVPVPGTEGCWALEPHDLAAVKLLVGRPKDLKLLNHLCEARLLQAETVRARVEALDIPIERLPRVLANFRNIFEA